MLDTPTSPKIVMEGHMVTSDGVTLRYQESGDGPPLILLHGWSQSGAMFREQQAGLARRYRVVVPDLRGHGSSPKSTDYRGLRMARLAKDLDELFTHLSLSQAHVLGWSMGASTVWSFIDLFGTSRINRLILVDQPAMLTIWPGMNADEVAECGALFTPLQLESLYNGLLSSEGAALRAGFVRGMVTKNIPAALFEWLVAEVGKTPLPVAAQLLWSHCSQDWRDVLPRIDRPTLVIAGSVSHVDPRSQYYIQRRIPQAKLREFSAEEGGAHFMFIEAPTLFNSVVDEFLSA